jgi:heme exporter protein C
MAMTMLLGMLVMALAFWAYSIVAALVRVRCIMLERDARSDWSRKAVGVLT